MLAAAGASRVRKRPILPTRNHAALSAAVRSAAITKPQIAFARNWSFLVEYDYYGFGTKSVTLTGCGGPGCGSPASETFPLKQNLSVVKAGINFRFGSQ